MSNTTTLKFTALLALGAALAAASGAASAANECARATSAMLQAKNDFNTFIVAARPGGISPQENAIAEVLLQKYRDALSRQQRACAGEGY